VLQLRGSGDTFFSFTPHAHHSLGKNCHWLKALNKCNVMKRAYWLNEKMFRFNKQLESRLMTKNFLSLRKDNVSSEDVHKKILFFRNKLNESLRI
jgi:hypothetical protein